MKWQMKNGNLFATNVAIAWKQNSAWLGAILTPGEKGILSLRHPRRSDSLTPGSFVTTITYF